MGFQVVSPGHRFPQAVPSRGRQGWFPHRSELRHPCDILGTTHSTMSKAPWGPSPRQSPHKPRPCRFPWRDEASSPPSPDYDCRDLSFGKLPTRNDGWCQLTKNQ